MKVFYLRTQNNNLMRWSKNYLSILIEIDFSTILENLIELPIDFLTNTEDKF